MPARIKSMPHKRVHARLRHARKRVHARLRRAMGAVHRKAWTQNRENNPMQSRMDPRLAALVLRCVRGTRRKMVRRHGPHLIPLWSSSGFSTDCRFPYFFSRSLNVRLPTHLTWSAFPAVADCAFGILETHLRGTERLECAACERRRSPIPTVPTPSASYWTGLGAKARSHALARR